MRYRVQVLGWALIWGGVFVFGYLAWQVWGTDLVNSWVQSGASAELAEDLAGSGGQSEDIDSSDFLGSTDVPAGVPDVVRHFDEDPPAHGEPFGFISIPDIGLLDVVLYEGVDRATLKNGPGHMEGTPLPGQPGNAVLSGHRTTYGRPFYDLDLLTPGDEILVETSVGTHTYEVREMMVVAPTDVWVTDARPGGWLTLTTCNPKFSARQRLIVWAEMVSGPNLDYVHLHEARFN